MDATIVDLRYRMKHVLRAIDRGETVTVLYRGKKTAKLIPMRKTPLTPGDPLPKTQDQPFFGLWKDRDDMAEPVEWVRNLRQPRSLAPQSNGPKRSNVARKK